VIELYIDGEEAGNKEPLQTTTAPVYIGKGGTDSALGIIDEVAIFNTALSYEDGYWRLRQ